MFIQNYLALTEDFLNESVVLEKFPGLHNSDYRRLQIHFTVLLHRVVGSLDLLRRLLLNGPGNPELGPLVGVLEIEGDDGLLVQTVRVDVEQFGVHQRLNISRILTRVNYGKSQFTQLFTLETVRLTAWWSPAAPRRTASRTCRRGAGRTSG